MTCDLITLDALEMYRGDGDSWTVYVKADGSVMDLTGYEFKFTARESFPNKTVTDDTGAAISVDGVITDAPNGVVEVEITSDQTVDLDIRNYYYDYQLTAPGGNNLTIGIGRLNILNELTRG